MAPNLPLCCSPAAFALLADQIPVMDAPDALLYGAIAVSIHQLDWVDVVQVDQTLQSYVDTIRSRVRGSQPQAMLAHLHEFLFEEQQFKGNADDYYNPINNYLPNVLQSKRGLPITLSLIYKVVAERLGLTVWGVGMPGHFLVAVETDGAPLLVDPFGGGQVLSRLEAHQRLCDLFGPEAEWTDDLLQPVSNRYWLTRIMQNLLTNFGGNGHYADVAAVLEMEMLLWPEQARLQRDLALVLARVGLTQPASAWLDYYLQNNPDDPQKTDLKQLLEVLAT